MLVLSRREREKLVFPNIGVTIKIMRINGKSVRVGVEAPQEVRVLRHEIAETPHAPAVASLLGNLSGMSNHRLRNHLNKLQLGLHLLQRQVDQGLNSESEATLQTLLAGFETLDSELGSRQQPSSTHGAPLALIVEDDKNESELLAGFLRMSGFDVDVATDGCHALEYLATRERPRIVLLDMQMPRCDGPTTLSAIRQHPDYEGLSVFGVSGRRPDELGIQVGPDGVDHWFTKPVNPESLVSEMNRHLATVCSSV